MLSKAILQLERIGKSFGPTRALQDVSFDILEGEIHAILGQNGAGKSTLVNILDSVFSEFEGKIIFRGHEVSRREMKEQFRTKLGVVHQEFPLIPHLSVAENIYLGELTKRKNGYIEWNKIYEKAAQLLDTLKIHLDVQAKIIALSAGERQLVSIARALAKNPEVLVFDEATSTLTDNEVEILFELLNRLKANGRGIIFISHKIEEILQLADRVTILRDGMSVGTKKTSEIDRYEMISLMAGRTVENQFPPRLHCAGDEMLRIENLSGEAFQNCSFAVRSGEVLGIAGLVGSGRPELLKTIFGAMRAKNGSIWLDGKQISIRKPLDAIQAGIYFVPSERRKEGVFQQMSIRDNLTISMLRNYSRAGWIDQAKEQEVAGEYIEKLKIKTTGDTQLIKELSGGNQQKVIISRWLSGTGRVFLFDEPTRGLDVGVKYDVYELINQIKQSGGAVIMVSSELPELLAMSDRVITMYEGKVTAEMDNDNLDQETVLESMMNPVREI